MKIRAAACVLVCLLAATPVAAQPPRPPTAAEFQALANQVATLRNQVTALGNTVASLTQGTVTAADLAGTWIIVSRGLALVKNPPRIGEDFSTSTMVLRTDGTGTITFNGANTDLTLTVPATFSREAGTFSGSFTWTTDGTGLTITFPDGGQLGGYLAAGGRALLTAIASTNGPEGSWSDIWQGIKLPPQ